MTGLYNPMTTIGKMTKPFEHPYKGIVVQVENDPEYIGRIKVNIPELYGEYLETSEGSTAGILPWIYPRYFGKFAGKIEFSVPEVGEVVEIIFPYKNPYLGYYTNKPLSKSIWDTLSSLGPEGQEIVSKFKEHYPNVYGSLDKNLTGWYVDKITNEVFIVQGGQKANITMNAEGSIVVNSPKDMIFTAGENIVFNAGTEFKVVTPAETHSINNTYSLNATNINTVGTMSQTGAVGVTGAVTVSTTITAIGEIMGKLVALSTHTHNYNPGPGAATPTDKPNQS